MKRDWGELDMRWMWVGMVLTASNLLLMVWWQQGGIRLLALLGMALYAFGLVLLAVPIVILRRRGGVARGAAFVETSRLVTSGLYGVVRHPQYLGWLAMTAAAPLCTQRPVAAALAVASACTTAYGFRLIDAWEIKVFGEEYVDYMQRVPGFNLPLGLWRALRRQRT